MSKYTDEEKEMFAAKDRRISLQGVVQVLLATGAEPDEIEENVALAEKYRKEIERVAAEEHRSEKNAVKEVSTKVIPTPNATQNQILMMIADKLESESGGVCDWDSLCSKVLEWSKTIPGVTTPTYPQRRESIDKFIKWLDDNKNE